GVPITRVIEINGETQAGSNPEALFARGLDNLTIRPLDTSLPPDETWVNVTYQTPAGEQFTVKLEWLVYKTDDKPLAKMMSSKRRAAIDLKKAKINQLKKLFFAPTSVHPRKAFADVFYSEVRQGPGRKFGYIRLFSFEVDNSNALVRELKRVVTADGFPQQGLIIDVRGNGGGKIRAGERILQFFTPRRIKPELFQFINSPLNLEICRREALYRPLAPS